mmetsp:Transcript_77580/g.209744  ORF Transcript_77580/g.209744 Transcript_77580/m.209744 type:complete len:210 (+) Transcript_77580:1-630(+)
MRLTRASPSWRLLAPPADSAGRSLVDPLDGGEAAAAHGTGLHGPGGAPSGRLRAERVGTGAAHGQVPVASVRVHEGVRAPPLHAHDALVVRGDRRGGSLLAPAVPHHSPRLRHEAPGAQALHAVLHAAVVAERHLVLPRRKGAERLVVRSLVGQLERPLRVLALQPRRLGSHLQLVRQPRPPRSAAVARLARPHLPDRVEVFSALGHQK